MLTFLNVVMMVAVAVFASMPFVFIFSALADSKENKK